MRMAGLLLGVTLVTACGGGGGPDVHSSCGYVGGTENCVDADGCTNPTNSNDSDLASFAEIATLAGGIENADRGASGAQFPAGSNAGVFVTLPGGFSASDITVSTLLAGGAVESATGPALTITPTSGDPAAQYVGFSTTAPFNGVQLAFNSTASQSTLVYEFCGTAVVR